MSAGALSPKQFNKEQSIMMQGNMDELANRVRGIQTMTSNAYTPAFSTDYNRVHSMPSGTADGGRPSSGQVEEDEDEEA